MTNTKAQERFAAWVKENKPDQYKWWQENESEQNHIFDKSWTYREMYQLLGGEIESKTGKVADYKPKNHAEAVRRAKEWN